MQRHNLIPSSSPGFGTPVHPIRPYDGGTVPSILPVVLPPAILRPVAFRLLTKKNGLTLSSAALQLLATFIGRNCGASWREGSAEDILNAVAREWQQHFKQEFIISGEDGGFLDKFLSELAGRIKGGRVTGGRTLDSVATEDIIDDPRGYLSVIDAYQQPRLIYNVTQKHFDKDPSKSSILPSPSLKTQVFRNRYNIIHQRLLRNESFQTPSTGGTAFAPLKRTASALTTKQQSYKLTPIANLLGRSGSNHLLLGLLTIAPAGTLAINDLTGSIALDLSHARTVPEDGAWFVPGMIVLVDGVYEEEDTNTSGALGGGGGVGGTIGGKFVGFTVGGPPCERRQVTLGVSGSNDKGDITAAGGFGWVDFLGVGSERETGPKMRRIEQQLIASQSQKAGPNHRGRVVILGEVTIDQPRTLQALRKVLSQYATEPEEDIPMTFVLMGNFVHHAAMARNHSTNSISYKESFDALASTLSDFPTLLQSSTFIFVPGDNDGWESSFSSGAATALPHKQIPDLFRTRVKRVFVAANAEVQKPAAPDRIDGEAIWTSNPARVALFGATHEIVLFRDAISSRFRRTAIRFSNPADEAADEDDIPMTPPPATAAEDELETDLHISRKLVKTVLDQGYLSPFPMAKRPVHWSYAGALHLYPLPTALVLADVDAPAFCVTYEGCHVMNPGGLVAPGRRGVARWVEYEVGKKAGRVLEALF